MTKKMTKKIGKQTKRRAKLPKFSTFDKAMLVLILLAAAAAPFLANGSYRSFWRDLPDETLMSTVSDVDQPLPEGAMEHSHYVVKDDLVYVNNKVCAYSGVLMRDEDLGMFTSRVSYDGPNTTFNGKTLVFNQCCEMCERGFPEKWRKERDEIMLRHGLSN